MRENSYQSARFPKGEITEKERAENVSAQGSRTATFGVRVKTSGEKRKKKGHERGGRSADSSYSDSSHVPAVAGRPAGSSGSLCHVAATKTKQKEGKEREREKENERERERAREREITRSGGATAQYRGEEGGGG